MPFITNAAVEGVKAPTLKVVLAPIFKVPVMARFAPAVAVEVPIRVRFPPIAVSVDGRLAVALPLIARFPVQK